MNLLFSLESPLELFVGWLGPEGFFGSMLGVGFLGAILKTVIDKYLKPKVERTALANTEHERVSDMSLGLAERLEAEVTRLAGEVKSLREDLTTERDERQKLGDQVSRQNGTILKLRMYVARVVDFWTYLTDHWEEIRQRETPPEFPNYAENEET